MAPRLTIEASLDWEKGSTGNEQTIKLRTSTPYFDTTSDASVSGASVKVINNNSLVEFVFEDQNNGTYTTSNFVPVLNQSYTLEIVYNEETYTATETLMPVVEIAEITQSYDKGFDDSLLEINVLFDDPINEDNYYLLKLKEEGTLLPVFLNIEDVFRDGKRIKLIYEKDDVDTFIPGDIVDVTLFGISENYFNYMDILLTLSRGSFGVVPVGAKGNCVNIDNEENYAHGYFRLAQVVRTSYIFQ